MGCEVLAFVTLEIAQGRLGDVIDHHETIPEVLEAHATTGPGDLHCRIVSRTNAHLQHVLGRVLEVPGILRTATQIALRQQRSEERRVGTECVSTCSSRGCTSYYKQT